MPPVETGASPTSDGHGAAWFISPWRSDGAFLDGSLPRVKKAAPRPPDRRAGSGAPHIQIGGRDADGDAASARVAPSLIRGPVTDRATAKGSGATEAGQGAAENRQTQLHRRSGTQDEANLAVPQAMRASRP